MPTDSTNRSCKGCGNVVPLEGPAQHSALVLKYQGSMSARYGGFMATHCLPVAVLLTAVPSRLACVVDCRAFASDVNKLLTSLKPA